MIHRLDRPVAGHLAGATPWTATIAALTAALTAAAVLATTALVVLLPVAPARAADQPWRGDPHGLSRLDWEGKTLPAAQKGPENGDFTPGSERYDLQRSLLDLRLDPADGSVTGQVTHVFASLDDTLQTVVLDLATGLGLTVQSVTSAGQAMSSRYGRAFPLTARC